MNYRGCMGRGRTSALAVMLAVAVRGATVEIQLPLEANAFKQDLGAEIANAQCLICHSVEYVTVQPPLPRAFWKASVQKMQQKYGAAIPEGQIEPLADYLTRNYGKTNAATSGSSTLPASQPAPATLAHAGNLDGPQVATKYGCLGCHSPSTRIVGPAYREIAAKYQSDPDSAAKVEQQIQKGGSGKWGPIIMPPFPQVTPAEIKALTSWILGLK